MEAKNLADLYNLPPLEWAPIEARLDQGVTMAPDTGGPDRHSCWLATINADGSAHVNGIGAMWIDGTWWFATGDHSRKGRNLARDPRCSIAVSIRDADVVAEGEAARETDPATLTRLAKAWADQGWPAELDETRSGITAPFNAPSQGPPPWNVYRIKPHSVTVALGTEPGGLTRFRF